jgi:hypothetical protein
MAKATKKDESVAVTAKPKAANSLFASMGTVKVKPKEKEPETPRVKVTDPTVCAAIVKFNDERKLEKEHETLKKAAVAVVAPEAKGAHQNLSRLGKLVHKSIHVYDEKTGQGMTYQLGRWTPGDEAKGATKEGQPKAALAWEAIQAIFGEKTEAYFRQEVSLSVKEEFCTAETMALLQEKLGDDYARLFEAEPRLGFLKVAAGEAMQTLSRDCVLDDAVKANAVKASTAKLISLGWETFK